MRLAELLAASIEARRRARKVNSSKNLKPSKGASANALIHFPKKLLILTPQILTEATRETVGRYPARRDPPHFQGDEYHAHAELPGGYEAS
jgi:hypothetical protein